MKKAYANVTLRMDMAGISVKMSPVLIRVETCILNLQALVREGNRYRAVGGGSKITRFKCKFYYHFFF